MNLPRLVLNEIAHRPWSFVLGTLLVAVSLGVFCAVMALLRSFDRETEEIVAGMKARSGAEMSKLEDQIRRSMKGLGFNIFIFPEGQDLGEVYSQGYASKTMPEDYVHQLADSAIVKVNHLLPQLTQRLMWPEQERTVVLVGVRGEVPIKHRSPKKALIDPVPPGKVVLGYELHKRDGLQPGETVAILGREFEIEQCHGQRGTEDDITMWMDLATVQAMLGKEGEINSILALECNCASVDRLGEIRTELGAILPGVEIVESGSKALARAEARVQAKKTHEAQLQEIETHRSEIAARNVRLAGMLLPLVGLLGAAGVGVLTWINARQRTTEVGTLMAIGVDSGAVLTAFLARAVLLGVVGVLLAILAAVGAGALLEGVPPASLLSPGEWLAAVGLCLFTIIAAAWLPSFFAAQSDPTTTLRHD